MSNQLKLQIITQENELLSEDADSVTVPGVQGEMTILPGHVPLFTKIQAGELTFRVGKDATTLVVGDGFLDVGPSNTIIVLVDSATLERDISLQQAEEAKKLAEESMKDKGDRRSFIMAEAAMRKALIEMKIAQKRSSNRVQ